MLTDDGVAPAPEDSAAKRTESRADLIRRLCDDWCAAVRKPEGGFALGPRTEGFRLHRNGVVFHELEFEELQTACVSLGRVLLLSGLNTVIDYDHFLLWSWLGQILVSRDRKSRPQDDREVRELLGVCVRAALGPFRPPPVDEYTWHLHGEIDRLTPFHLGELGNNTHRVLAYLSFPALEGILKIACSNYVSLSGAVLSPFSVLSRSGRAIKYVPSGRRNRCSSLRDLLLLHYERVAAVPLRTCIREVRDHIGALQSGADGFDVLFDWRNSSVHGSASWHTIGGTVLTLALLIALEDVRGDFEVCRTEAFRMVQRESGIGIRSPWSYYPP
jgi:hypothetical protein